MRKKDKNVIVEGVHTGGVWVVEQLRSVVETGETLATLDMTFYPDDFTRPG